MKTGRATDNGNRSKTNDLLLRHPNFVAKSPNARREASPLACETNRRHFTQSGKNSTLHELAIQILGRISKMYCWVTFHLVTI